MANCDLVVEAVFENLALKHKVVAQMEEVCAKESFITNSLVCIHTHTHTHTHSHTHTSAHIYVCVCVYI
jgi:3-hydroxyacyl-CoA dehydrogenase